MSITNHGDIVALREQLFASMRRLSAKKIDPKEIGRAKAIADTAQVIINSDEGRGRFHPCHRQPRR